MKAFSFQETGQFLPYHIGATARDTLQEFIDIDVSADDLVRILNRNQVYRSLFFRFIAKKTAAPDKNAEGKDKEQDSPTHRLVNLLGMIGSRNLIVALQLHKAKEGSFPVMPDGSVEIKSADLLKTAIDSEELFLRNNLEYSETAYAAGVFFDCFLNTQAKDPNFKKSEPYFRDIVKRAQRTGVIAYLLAEDVAGFTPKYAIAAGMLTQAGKLLLAANYPDAKGGYAELERAHEADAKLPALARSLAERAAFGVAHEEVSAHLLHYYDVFHSLTPAVRYFREPYCLKEVDAQNYKFAVLLGLADRMAGIWRTPVDDKDPVFGDWATPATAILKMRKEKLIEIMKRAMNLK
ncbi:MAG: HDOD domain-containing protein [Bacteriovoracia bacterium]